VKKAEVTFKISAKKRKLEKRNKIPEIRMCSTLPASGAKSDMLTGLGVFFKH